MKKGIIYCRVSTKHQKSDGASLENQEKACKEYSENMGINITGIFKEAFTGHKANRPEFEKAIKKAKQDKVSYFIIYDIDRFSREGYDIYMQLKKELKTYGIQLKDSKRVISESRMVAKNDIFDMTKYDWNFENPSEYAEVFLSTQALSESRKIKQRTIPRAIELEQLGFHVRPSNFGYKNKTSPTPDGKKAKIQVKHPFEGDWVIEIFDLRARGVLSDTEIVKILNQKGCKKRSGLDLDVKYLQRLISNPIYAGVMISEWTGNKPIKTAYDGLVTIDVWNQANRGKAKILELNNNEVLIKYNSGEISIINEPIKVKRRKYNPYYPYAKVLKCPLCGGVLTANTSKSKSGTLHYYYQCRGKNGAKHNTYTIKRTESHNTILDIFKSIKVDNATLLMFNELTQEVYKEKEEKKYQNTKNFEKKLIDLEKREKEILANIDKLVNFPTILEEKNKELENIKIKKSELRENIKNSKIDTNLTNFKKYATKLITHLDNLALQKEKPELIHLAFDIVFGGKIEYEKISKHTPFFDAFCPNLSHQKNPQDEDSLNNFDWYGYGESNPGCVDENHES